MCVCVWEREREGEREGQREVRTLSVLLSPWNAELNCLQWARILLSRMSPYSHRMWWCYGHKWDSGVKTRERIRPEHTVSTLEKDSREPPTTRPFGSHHPHQGQLNFPNPVPSVWVQQDQRCLVRDTDNATEETPQLSSQSIHSFSLVVWKLHLCVTEELSLF